MMTTRLVTTAFEWLQSAAGSFADLRGTHNSVHSKQFYRPPELFFVGCATDLILARIECKSKEAAKRVRRLIDEYDGSLSFSPARECQKLQVDLPLVSKQFKRLYHVTIRSYSGQIRMKTAERLLRESDHLNIDEIARVFGYSFTSSFSRCFQRRFGKRPKRYQMQRGSSFPWQTTEGSMINPRYSVEA
jgi:AraC-like DNA-binding protein